MSEPGRACRGHFSHRPLGREAYPGPHRGAVPQRVAGEPAATSPWRGRRPMPPSPSAVPSRSAVTARSRSEDSPTGQGPAVDPAWALVTVMVRVSGRRGRGRSRPGRPPQPDNQGFARPFHRMSVERWVPPGGLRMPSRSWCTPAFLRSGGLRAHTGGRGHRDPLENPQDGSHPCTGFSDTSDDANQSLDRNGPRSMVRTHKVGCISGQSPSREADSPLGSGGFRAQECITAGDR